MFQKPGDRLSSGRLKVNVEWGLIDYFCDIDCGQNDYGSGPGPRRKDQL